MGQIYRFLGLEVGCIVHDLDDEQRQAAYAADVTYATNNELGFDYLRDNMKYQRDAMAQRGHNFAIVDEVDSILIDEARTPLIISGPIEDKSDLYNQIDTLIPKLVDDDFEIDEKQRTASLTEQGNDHVEDLLEKSGLLEGRSLYEVESATLVHHVNQALRAHKLYSRDTDYIVKNDEVIIIDEFTGRMMEGRRYSEGLHQALEAKEHVAIQPENQTLASVTFQNYFRLYDKLSGMTGTAITEASEFHDIYKLEVLEIPTHMDICRDDTDDEVYRTDTEKFNAVIELIKDCHERGQPILVGTTSIQKSELLAEMLKQRKVEHNVLNARYHEQEAKIISKAGFPGAVTIATNMAGRGTDIQLGGNLDMLIAEEISGLEDEKKIAKIKEKITAEVAARKVKALEAGGLCVLGTERHESRRIDNQLRGRSGRQGDPGRSHFFLSLEDDLMRIFGTDRMDGMLKKLGLEEGEAIVHPWINKALEKAQQKVEARNYDIRKNLLKFDDVMNDQRTVIFEQRLELMDGDEVADTVVDMRHQVIEEMVSLHIPERAYAEQWDVAGLKEKVKEVLNLDLPIDEWAQEEGIADQEIRERLLQKADQAAAKKAADISPEVMRDVEKAVLLQTLDHLWREHLVMLEHFRQVVGLRGYGQRDPLNEYKTEGFTLFESLLVKMREMVTTQLLRIEMAEETAPSLSDADFSEMEAQHLSPLTEDDEFDDDSVRLAASYGTTVRNPSKEDLNPADPETWGKIPRNSTCPCGSGKKFKHCHGRLA